jgi:DNA-binding transcriptional ArsR family regulator
MTGELKEIIEIIKSPVFTSSVRIGILLILLGVDKITFTDLLKSLDIPKSSLYYHLKILEENELIIIRDVITITRPRTIIQITPKGKLIIEKYIELLGKIQKKK